jgi:hypothetical protein
MLEDAIENGRGGCYLRLTATKLLQLEGASPYPWCQRSLSQREVLDRNTLMSRELNHGFVVSTKKP